MDSKKLDVEASYFDSEFESKFNFPSLVFEENNIFKYGSFNYLQKTLENNTLKFASISDYNDPFEIDYSINLHLEKSDKSGYEEIDSIDFNNPNDDYKLRSLPRHTSLVKEIRDYADNYFDNYIS